MATTVIRKPASFRLRADLLEGLKRNAARENRTLNNYVESVLLGIVFDEPNEETKAAIKEATSGKNPNKVYDSVDELFKDLDAEKWKSYIFIFIIACKDNENQPAYGMVILLVNKTNERLHDPSTLLYTFSDQYIVDDIIREIQGWLFFPVFIF